MSERIQRIREDASVLDLRAQVFRHQILPAWWDALDTLDAATASSQAFQILNAWEDLHKLRETIEAVVKEEQAAQGAAALGGMLKAGIDFAARFAGMDDAKGAGDASAAKAPEPDKAEPAKGKQNGDAASAQQQPKDPNDLLMLHKARSEYDQARYRIGDVVTLQKLFGQHLLGSLHHYPSEHDPSNFIIQERYRAVNVLTSMKRIREMFDAPAKRGKDGKPELSKEQMSLAADIIKAHPIKLELLVLQRALVHQGYQEQWNTVASRKDILRHRTKLYDRAMVTRDERDGHGVSTTRLEEMMDDVQELKEEAHATVWTSDSKVNSILSRYQSAGEREIFFSLLERENVIDPLLKRADAGNLQELMDSTSRHKGRRYNESFDTSMTLGEKAGYIGMEALRQGPGAACHFAAGVYNGMSHIPGIGDVFKESAQQFRELAGYLDEKTGADDTGRKYRNGVAEIAGNIETMLLVRGASAEMAAVEGVALVNAGAKTYATVTEASELCDQLWSLKGTYEQGKLLWDNFVSVSTHVPELLASIAYGDLDGAVSEISALFDDLIGNVGGTLETNWKTDAIGDSKKKLARLEESASRNDHIVAKIDLARATRELAANPDSVPHQMALDAAAKRMKQTEAVRRGDASRRPEGNLLQPQEPKDPLAQRIHSGANDVLKGLLIKVARQILIKLKEALVNAVMQAHRERQQLAAGGKEPDAASGDDKRPGVGFNMATGARIEAFVGNALAHELPKLTGPAVDWAIEELTGFGVDMLWKISKMIMKDHPELFAFEGMIKARLAEIAGVGLEMFDVSKMANAPIEAFAHKMTVRFARGAGYDVEMPAADDKTKKPSGAPS